MRPRHPEQVHRRQRNRKHSHADRNSPKWVSELSGVVELQRIIGPPYDGATAESDACPEVFPASAAEEKKKDRDQADSTVPGEQQKPGTTFAPFRRISLRNALTKYLNQFRR